MSYVGNRPDAVPFDLSPFYEMMRGRIGGLTLANNATDATNDIDIAVGGAMDSTNTDWMALSSALTKRLDAAWSAGTNQGGLDTGSIANGTYHVFLIKDTANDVVDVLFSASATAPTMPTGYTLFRRIGSILRESAVIVPFVQFGDEFWRQTPINDITASNPGTSAVTRTLSVPLGIKVQAIVHALLTNAGGASDNYVMYLSSLDCVDLAATNVGQTQVGEGAGSFHNAGTQARVWTNTSGQIRSRISLSTAQSSYRLTTAGWMDRRGQDD